MNRKFVKDSPGSKRGSSSSKRSSSLGALIVDIQPPQGFLSPHVGEDQELSSKSSKLVTGSELQRLRLRHTRAIAKLIVWTEKEGIDLVLGEGYLMLARRFRLPDGNIAKGEDAVHMRAGNHYRGLAVDCLLYVKGVYITDGGSPLWAKIGRKWESLDLLARWGGHFGDANHLSFIYQGIR